MPISRATSGLPSIFAPRMRATLPLSPRGKDRRRRCRRAWPRDRIHDQMISCWRQKSSNRTGTSLGGARRGEGVAARQGVPRKDRTDEAGPPTGSRQPRLSLAIFPDSLSLHDQFIACQACGIRTNPRSCACGRALCTALTGSSQPPDRCMQVDHVLIACDSMSATVHSSTSSRCSAAARWAASTSRASIASRISRCRRVEPAIRWVPVAPRTRSQ